MTRYQSAAEAAGRTAAEQEQRQRKRRRTAAERKQRREERSRTAAARARPRRNREPPAPPARQPARPRLRQRSRRPPPRPRLPCPAALRDLREHLHHRSPHGSPAAPAQRLRQLEQPARSKAEKAGTDGRKTGRRRPDAQQAACSISSSPPRLLRALHALRGLDDRSSAAETRKRPEKQFCTLRDCRTGRPRVDIRAFFHAPETRGASTFWPATSQKNFGSVPSSPHHPLFQPSRRSSPFSYSQSQSTAKRSSTK